MRWSPVVRLFASLTAMVLAFLAQPASARRTVFDTWGFMYLGDQYCSPNECNAFSTPFSVQIGGTSYNTFYANSNGTLSFGSIWSPYLAQQTQLVLDPFGDPIPNPYLVSWPPEIQTNLSAYPVPIFSPNFADGPGFDNVDTPMLGVSDGNFVAQVLIGANSFTVSWYPCDHPQACGLDSVDAALNTAFDPFAAGDDISFVSYLMLWSTCTNNLGGCTPEEDFASGRQNFIDARTNFFPIYTMTLTNLTNGFQVDFSYNQGTTGQVGTYGYSLPIGSHQVTGPLTNQSYFFSSLGPLNYVPEPASWMTMLLGFGTIGMAVRRKRKLQALAA